MRNNYVWVIEWNLGTKSNPRYAPRHCNPDWTEPEAREFLRALKRAYWRRIQYRLQRYEAKPFRSKNEPDRG